jgi:hypothetical protein
LFFLLIVLPWENITKNVREWMKAGVIAENLYTYAPQWWILLIALLLIGIIGFAIIRYRRDELPLAPESAFGRAQMLFLLIMWVFTIAALTQAFPRIKDAGTFSVHTRFWFMALVCTLIVLCLRDRQAEVVGPLITADDDVWLPGWKHGALWALVPILLFILTKLTLAMHHEPLPGSHLRFGTLP